MRYVAVAVLVMCACGRIDFDALDALADAPQGPTQRSVLTVNAAGVTVTDFPLLVVLDDTRAARDLMKPDASDLRFFDSDGNVIPHEIEQVGAPGGTPLVAWVRVPLIDGPTTITIDYGHGTPVAASTQPVWPSPYAAVFHMGDLVDSTPNKLTGTWMGGPETVTDAQIAKGHVFDSMTSSAVAVAGNSAFAFPSGITLSTWVNAKSFSAASGFNAAVTQEWSGPSEVFWIGIEDSTRRGFAELGTAVSQNQGGSGGGILVAGTWYYLAMTYDGAVERFYVDGMEVRTTNVTGGALVATTHGIAIGADSNNDANPDADWFDGSIDEVRLESTVRSASWLHFENLVMRDQVITYGPVER